MRKDSLEKLRFESRAARQTRISAYSLARRAARPSVRTFPKRLLNGYKYKASVRFCRTLFLMRQKLIFFDKGFDKEKSEIYVNEIPAGEVS